jgi:hypothetical protein
MTPTTSGAAGHEAASAAGSLAASAVDPAADEVRPVVRQRAAQRKRRRRRVMIAQTTFTLLAVFVLVALLALGWRSAMRITGGRDEIVTDPDAPGYVAEVRPTSVTLVAVTGDGGELITMLMVISDPGASGITAVPFSPHTTLWDFEDAGPESAIGVFADGGMDVLRLRLGADLTFGSTESLIVPGSALVDIASPGGPLVVQLADDVFEGQPGSEASDISLRYPSGELEIPPEEIDDFLAFTGYREPDPNRALRSAAVWEALAERVEGPPPPGDVSGAEGGEDVEEFEELLYRFRTEGADYQIAPMAPVPLDVQPPVTIYRVDTQAMPAWVQSHVPFPVSAFPGQLATVAVLDGAGVDGVVRSVAPQIVGAGAEIALTGNAESFDVADSRVEFNRPEARGAAEDIAAALGLSATQGERADVDVTVVVGKDLVA